MDNTTKFSATFRGLVTHEQYLIIMEYYSEAGTVLSLIGIVSNIINVRTFIAMGVNDGITISFLSLSIFDLFYVVASFSLGISVAFGVIELRTTTRYRIDPLGVSIFLANIMVLVNVTNVLTTTFLAVARCLCVAKPLQFKNSFTKRKTLVFIFGFTVFAIISYAPVLGNMGIVTQYDKMVNTTRPTLWISAHREFIKVISWVVIDMILPVSTQLIVLVCVVVMAISLRAASRFRHASVLTSEKMREKSHDKDVLDGKKKVVSPGISTVTTNKHVGKDLRVIQQVVFISLIYIICNTPKIIICIVVSIEHEFALGRRYSNLYLSVNTLRQQFEIFNSAVNTFIYYRYNTKFKKTLTPSVNSR